MNRSLLCLLLAGSVLLTACETHVVARRSSPPRRVAYSDRVIYRDPSPAARRTTYENVDVRYRTRVGTNRDFPARPLDRSYGF